MLVINEFNKADFKWASNPVIGSVLLINGGKIDSLKNIIKPTLFYQVGKHKQSGKVCIIPVDKNLRQKLLNKIMKESGKFN